MRLPAAAVALGLLIGACTSESAPTTQVPIDVPAIPALPASTTTSAPTRTPSTAEPRDFQTAGALPDGTPFSVHIETPLATTVEEIRAGVMADIDGRSVSVGTVSFGQPQGRDDHFFHHGVDLPPGGGIQIDFDEEVLEALGPNHSQLIADSIRGTINNGYAGLDLDPPFRWATDEESVMEVRFDDFAVRRGCSSLSVACSPTHAVQVIPNQGVLAIASTYGRIGVFVESSASRFVADPGYLDRGPLAERNSADLMWTGSELLVWGGKTRLEGMPDLVDGAAFNPATDTWRLLAAFPQSDATASRAVWADGQMVVVSTAGTFGYDPWADQWELIADGKQPSEWPGRMLVIGEALYMWNAEGIHALDLATADWTELEGIFSRWPDPWFGSLFDLDGHLVAAWVPEGRCGGRSFAEWDGQGWDQLPAVSLATGTYADCSVATQGAAVASDLVIWEDSAHPTMAYSRADNSWRGVAWTPLPGAEGPSGPLLMGEQFLVPQWGSGAIYDSASELWVNVALPGHGTNTEMVWTGTEILAWGIWGTFDAWRWTPPEVD